MTAQQKGRPADVTFVLTNEQLVRSVVVGASRLGFTEVPIDQVRRGRFEQVENGALLRLWLDRGPSAPPPAPDSLAPAEELPDPNSHMLHQAMLDIMGPEAPAPARVEAWTPEMRRRALAWVQDVDTAHLVAKRTKIAFAMPDPPDFLKREPNGETDPSQP